MRNLPGGETEDQAGGSKCKVPEVGTSLCVLGKEGRNIEGE